MATSGGVARRPPPPRRPSRATTPSTTVSLDHSTATVFSTITATATPTNTSGDPVAAHLHVDGHHQLHGRPQRQRHSPGNGPGTLSLTDKLDLTTVTGVSVGDTIQVEVSRPSSDGLTGTSATAMATINAVSTPSANVAAGRHHSLHARHDHRHGDYFQRRQRSVSLTYVWTDTTNSKAGPNGNGVLQTTSNTLSTSDQLNLATATGVSSGDVIQVTVTPSSDGQTGTAVMAGATVHAASTPSVVVVLNNSKPTVFDSITATATPSSTSGDPVTLTYVWTDTTNSKGWPLPPATVSSGRRAARRRPPTNSVSRA